MASGRFFFRVRNALFPTLLLMILVATRPTQFLGSPALDRLAIAAGVLLVLGGQAFRMVVIGYAYIQRGGRNREVFANELVTRGFYAHTRNPMYVANFSVVVGFSLVYGSAWGYGLLVPLFAYIYLAITTAEETYLREKFSAAYDEYARRVNRFFPDLRGLRKSLAEFSYDWQRDSQRLWHAVLHARGSAGPCGLENHPDIRLCGPQEHSLTALRGLRSGGNTLRHHPLSQDNQASARSAQRGNGAGNRGRLIPKHSTLLTFLIAVPMCIRY
ncbi:MAG: isoprenylcysteine carboxylmethyltransferase family protein [Gammaproteobacteria bacterium]